MNDCLLESENFQITKSDNNKYLLLPVKKQAEKFVLKECGKDIDSDTNYLLSLSHTHTHTPIHISFLLFFAIKLAKKTQKLFLTKLAQSSIKCRTHFMFICWHKMGKEFRSSSFYVAHPSVENKTFFFISVLIFSSSAWSSNEGQVHAMLVADLNQNFLVADLSRNLFCPKNRKNISFVDVAFCLNAV